MGKHGLSIFTPALPLALFIAPLPVFLLFLGPVVQKATFLSTTPHLERLARASVPTGTKVSATVKLRTAWALVVSSDEFTLQFRNYVFGPVVEELVSIHFPYHWEMMYAVQFN